MDNENNIAELEAELQKVQDRFINLKSDYNLAHRKLYDAPKLAEKLRAWGWVCKAPQLEEFDFDGVMEEMNRLKKIKKSLKNRIEDLIIPTNSCDLCEMDYPELKEARYDGEEVYVCDTCGEYDDVMLI